MAWWARAAALLPLGLAATATAALAQEVVADRPPMYARLERVRVYLSPLTAATMRLDVEGNDEASSHDWVGVGISLGVDAVVHRHVALWANGHAGAVTGADATLGGRSGRLTGVLGAFRALAGGVAGVLSDGRSTGLFGIGLFFAGAEWEGRQRDTLIPVNQRATLAGIVSTLRADYTLRNGFFLGAGLDLGAGIAGGKAASGAADPRGEWWVLYIPLGWTY